MAVMLGSASAFAQDVAPGRLRLSSAQVDAVAARRLGRVRGCYKDSLAHDPNGYGVLAVGMKVGPDGVVHDRWIAMSTMGDPDLERCALKAFEGLVFPAPGDNGVEVRFGMLLSTDVKKKTDKNTELPDRAKLAEDAWKKSIAGRDPTTTDTPPNGNRRGAERAPGAGK